MTKEKVDKLDVIKIKNFSSTKDIIKKVKRQSAEWKIIPNNISDKSLLFRIYKTLPTQQPKDKKLIENGQRI